MDSRVRGNDVVLQWSRTRDAGETQSFNPYNSPNPDLDNPTALLFGLAVLVVGILIRHDNDFRCTPASTI